MDVDTLEYHVALGRDGTLRPAAAWRDLEMLRLRGVSQDELRTGCFHFMRMENRKQRTRRKYRLTDMTTVWW